MTKKNTAHKPFRLSGKAGARLNRYFDEIRKGIINVCEMHKHDSAPSMTQSEFEIAYVEKLLGQTVTAISLSIRSITEALAKQKETALKTLTQNKITEKETEDAQ